MKNKTKEQTGVFRRMLLGTLRASSLGNLLTDEGVKQSNKPGEEVMVAGEVTIRAS